MRSETNHRLPPMLKSMFFRCLAEPRTGIDIQQIIVIFNEALDLKALRRAFQRIVDRHEILRMRFLLDESGNPYMVPREKMAASLDFHNSTGLPLEGKNRLFEKYLHDDRLHEFDPREDPQIHGAVFCFGDLDYRLVYTHWHGVADGRAGMTLLKEVVAFYDAFRQGKDLDLPLPRPYTDFAEWVNGQETERAAAYWKDLFKDFAEPTPIAIDRPSADRDAGYGEHEIRLSKDISSRLQSAVKGHGLTVNTLFQGAWGYVMSRYTGQDDVVYGAPRACRHSAFDGDNSAEGMVGVVMNTLPVRIRIRPDMRVIDYLKDLREQHICVRHFEHTPLAIVQRYSGVPANQQLFDTIALYENSTLDAYLRALGGSWQSRTVLLRERTGYPITVYGYGESELLLKIANDRARIDDKAAKRMLVHLATVLQAMGEGLEGALLDLPLLQEDESHRLLVEWNRTGCPVPQEDSIHGCFEAQAARTPDVIAVTFQDERWTYRELDRRAERIACRLREAGARPDAIVGIYMERSPYLISSLLGVLKSGAAYLPLDPTYPTDRIAFMIADAQPLLVLADRSTSQRLSGMGVRIIAVDSDSEIQNPSVTTVRVEGNACANNLAYVIYTSGSTGKPKGVMLEHGNVTNLFAGMDALLGREPGVWLAVTSISFDIAVLELFWTLTRGYKIVLWPGLDAPNQSWIDDGEKNTKSITGLIRVHGVTHLQCTPSFLRMLTLLPGAIDVLASLKALLVGGEALPLSLVQSLGHSPTRRFINMYGPTETTVWSTTWQVESGCAKISIGRPIANTQIYILDRHRRPVPVGVPGELFIGGKGVARGYLNRPELTDERFVPNPFVGNNGARMYRTGDLVRYCEDGTVEFIGRIDHQIKIRGHRIELGEIEAILDKHPSLQAAAVNVWDGANNEKQLVAYIVPSSGGMPSTKEFREWVERELPNYMVPAAFVPLDSLPRTPNGKLDRRALPSPVDCQQPIAKPAERPLTAVEVEVSEIWAEILGVSHVGLDDSFFDLGGNSLSAVEMMVAIQQRFGLELPLELLFTAQTVAQLAEKVSATIGAPSSNAQACSPPATQSSETLSATQGRLLAIWERLLGTSPINIRESFFDLGGNGILLDQMLTEVRKEFGVFAEGFPIKSVAATPTIEHVASIIEKNINGSSSLIVDLQPQGRRRPLFLIHGAGGYIFFYRALASHLGPDQPVYAIRAEIDADNLGQPFHKSRDVDQLAVRYIKEIKKVQPHGPYFLGGGCFGGVIAFEMARQLREQGEHLGPVLLFSSFVLNNPDSEIPMLPWENSIVPLLKRRIKIHLNRASRLRGGSAILYLFRKALKNAPSEALVGIQSLLCYLRLLRSKFADNLRSRRDKIVPKATSPEPMRLHLMKVFLNATQRMLSKYVPGVYDGRLVLFRAANDDDPEPLWKNLARGGMDVHDMQGGHLDMMEEPLVGTTAELVRRYLDEEPANHDTETREESLQLAHILDWGRGEMDTKRV